MPRLARRSVRIPAALTTAILCIACLGLFVACDPPPPAPSRRKPAPARPTTSKPAKPAAPRTRSSRSAVKIALSASSSRRRRVVLRRCRQRSTIRRVRPQRAAREATNVCVIISAAIQPTCPRVQSSTGDHTPSIRPKQPNEALHAVDLTSGLGFRYLSRSCRREDDELGSLGSVWPSTCTRRRSSRRGRPTIRTATVRERPERLRHPRGQWSPSRFLTGAVLMPHAYLDALMPSIVNFPP